MRDDVGGNDDHGWVGRGKVRCARLGPVFVVRLALATTSAARLQAPIREFFRKHYRIRGADLRSSFSVAIWIEIADGVPGLDVDNVAKACLDACDGVIWRDDRQVAALSVTRLASERNAITIAAEPLPDAPSGADLEALLRRIESVPAGIDNERP